MTLRKHAVFGATLALIASASPAADAAPDDADACILTRSEAGAPVIACIEAAHSACAREPEEASAVAALCFRRAREDWSARIKAQMRKIQSETEGDVAVIAGIEVKYDILSGLLQCDRLEELALAVSNHTPERVVRQKTGCEATAVGLAYARLKWRTRGVQ